MIKRYGTNTVRNGGLKAYTTIDPELQEDAESAVADCTEIGTCYPGGPVTGLASVDPKTGAILALASTPAKKAKKNSTTPGRPKSSRGPRSSPTCWRRR